MRWSFIYMYFVRFLQEISARYKAHKILEFAFYKQSKMELLKIDIIKDKFLSCVCDLNLVIYFIYLMLIDVYVITLCIHLWK